MTIGQRAYQAVMETAERKGISFLKECARMDVNPGLVKEWKTRNNPSANILQVLAKGGYDIHYILTGEESIKHEDVIRCRNCVWYEPDGEYCELWSGVRRPDHFCGEGDTEIATDLREE